MATVYVAPSDFLKFGQDRRKRLGGLRGDSAALNWFLAIGIVAGSICVIVWAQSFINAYNVHATQDQRSYNTAYYTSQYALALAVLTLAFETLYVLWVFADARHPMRKAYQFAQEQGDGTDKAIPIDPSTGRQYPRPGMGTMRFANLHRFTTSRLFAERQHIQRLAIAQGVFVIAWLVPFLLMALKDGWLRFDQDKRNHNVRVTRMCGPDSIWEVCGELAKAGISTGVVTLLFLISMVASLVAMQARQTVTS